jgi:hypothetical protein
MQSVNPASPRQSWDCKIGRFWTRRQAVGGYDVGKQPWRKHQRPHFSRLHNQIITPGAQVIRAKCNYTEQFQPGLCTFDISAIYALFRQKMARAGGDEISYSRGVKRVLGNHGCPPSDSFWWRSNELNSQIPHHFILIYPMQRKVTHLGLMMTRSFADIDLHT